MNDFLKMEHKTQWIALGNLSVVWSHAQRRLDERRAKQIADNFDPDHFGIITVTQANDSGVYHVIDGQHRVTAARQLFGDKKHVPCNIFSCDDPTKAAQIFDKMNTGRKQPDAIDTFNVRVTAGVETECAVNKIVRSCGFKIGHYSADGYIRAAKTCITIYSKYGGPCLKDTIDTLNMTWNLDKDAMDVPLLRGMAAFLNEHGGAVDRKQLALKLSKATTPGRLAGAGKITRDTMRCGIAEAVSRLIMNHYNAGRRSGRLGD